MSAAQLLWTDGAQRSIEGDHAQIVSDFVRCLALGTAVLGSL